ncbi:HNH endonuclease signature motif containing protein [Paenarthrobacter sp. PH39-S1]|uniref:HNH endonuclease signature motif containing protein n=1 Tax=Paenarthrobacter sp. PH39-S1 TaxID=3046204 RepID=UPI0024BA2E61|nr:HNH endonuclease signature motif containing protein [Paenarthrobacter sp. PH39-S1]MDJ0355977.1 DUF222 domain-containing protein [Paenarthrobacter sp. PH39-S1]
MDGGKSFETLLGDYLGIPPHARPEDFQADGSRPEGPHLTQWEFGWGPARTLTGEDLCRSLKPSAVIAKHPGSDLHPSKEQLPDLQVPDAQVPDAQVPHLQDAELLDANRQDNHQPDGDLQVESVCRALLAGLVREEDPDRLDPLRTAEALLLTDPAGGDADQKLDYAAAAGKMVSWAQAIQTRAVAAFAAERPPLPAETPRRCTVPARSEWISERSRYAAAEIGAALHIGRYSAQRLLDNSDYLTSMLPATLAQHEQGLLDRARVHAVLSGLGTTPAELWGPVEDAITALAPSLTPKALERHARETAEKLDPEPLAARHERARTHRDVWFFAQPDGMAEIGALLPAVDARRFYETIDAWAHHAQHEGEPSTGTTPGGKPSRAINEYRADVMIDLFNNALAPDHTDPDDTDTSDCTDDTDTGNAGKTGTDTGNAGKTGTDTGNAGKTDTGNAGKADTDTSDCTDDTDTGNAGKTGTGNAGKTARGRRGRKAPRYAPAQIAVTVPVLTLMGLDERPGNLNGYGPIPADQARELAGQATSWLRFLTDPENGTILSIGRTAYEPAADLRRWIINRDKTCRGIGCDKPARLCDIDHTIPYHRQTYAPDGTPLPLGETSDTNLGPLCTADHHLKDDPGTGWTLTQPTPGVFIHTSPTGRVYPNNPEPPPPF